MTGPTGTVAADHVHGTWVEQTSKYNDHLSSVKQGANFGTK